MPEVIDKEYGLHVWTNGTIITLDGNIYHKILFLTAPLVTTKKKWQSGLGSWDNIVFQVSLTEPQILAFREQLERLIETLKIVPEKESEAKP